MLPEALTALSAAGGAAVVQAAGTDAWAGFPAPGGVAAGGDVTNRAEGSVSVSVSVGVIHGGVRIENPTPPRPPEG
jgi:hypothetical protein